MAEKTEKATLEFSREEAIALNGLIFIATSNPLAGVWVVQRLKAEGVENATEVLLAVVDRFSDVVHEHNWCIDPNCKRKDGV